jgi:hypothetical protein
LIHFPRGSDFLLVELLLDLSRTDINLLGYVRAKQRDAAEDGGAGKVEWECEFEEP